MREPDDANALPAERDSAPGRYVGAVREYFFGNVERAKTLRLLALNFLGDLRNQLAMGGRQNGARRVVLNDSSKIEVIWDGVINTIRVFSPVVSEEVEEEIQYPYLSGLQEIAAVENPLFGPYRFASQFYPAWRVPGGREKQWYQYNLNFPDIGWPETPTDAETIANDPDVRFIHEWVKTTLPNVDAGPLGLKEFPAWPGMYTGRMRYVVQKLLGKKAKSPFSYNSGLWTPEGTEPVDRRQRWVIEISATTGVTAYPIYFVDEIATLDNSVVNITALSEEERERYDYLLQDGFTIPTQVSTNPANAFGDANGTVFRYQLLPPEDMVEISDGKGTLTPWYSNWAFSYTGREAQIVYISLREYSKNPGVYYAQRYKITFIASTFLLAGNRIVYPVVDSLTEVEGDYLYTSKFNFDLFAPYKDPYQEQIYFESVIPAPLPESRDAPIYVFYTRDDEEVVLYRKDEALSAINETNQVGIDCTSLGCTVPCVYCDQPYRGGPPMCADTGCQRYTGYAEACCEGFTETISGQSNYALYYCERTVGEEGNFNFSGMVFGKYRWVDWNETPAPGNNAVCNLLFYDFVVVTEWLYSFGHQLITADHEESRTRRSVITLPLYDREGFFHYFAKETTYSGSFLHQYSINNDIRRTSKIRGPYAGMGEVSAVAPYAFPGFYHPSYNETVQPDNVIEPQYLYIGAVSPNAYGADDSVITLDNPPEGTSFSDGMTSVAAIEMFSGRAFLAPHPPIIENEEEEDVANLWFYEEDGTYPVTEAYRSENLLSPKYFCFIGDGNIVPKSGTKVDLYAIPYLAENGE